MLANVIKNSNSLNTTHKEVYAKYKNIDILCEGAITYIWACLYFYNPFTDYCCNGAATY